MQLGHPAAAGSSGPCAPAGDTEWLYPLLIQMGQWAPIAVTANVEDWLNDVDEMQGGDS